MEETDRSRFRTLNEGVRRAREAIRFLRPFNRRIEDWQLQLAFLQAAPGQQSKLAVLRAQVAATAEAFAAGLARLPPEIKGESRVVDTGKALGRLLERIEAVTAAGEPRPRAAREETLGPGGGP